MQICVCRENSFGTDEPTDLKHQREKCRKIDEAERAKEEPARNQAVRGAMLRVEQPADGGRRSPVHERRPLYRGWGVRCLRSVWCLRAKREITVRIRQKCALILAVILVLVVGTVPGSSARIPTPLPQPQRVRFS